MVWLKAIFQLAFCKSLSFRVLVVIIIGERSAINDVTAGGGKGFCEDSTKALIIKSVTIGGKYQAALVIRGGYVPRNNREYQTLQ